MARVTHFEIPVENPEKSIQFYTDVFGWEFNQFGEEEYWLTKTGADEDYGIDGAIMKRKDPNQPVTNTIEVKDLEETKNKIEQHGGKIVVPRMAIPKVGWLIFFKDLDGNIFGVMEPNNRID